MNSCRLRVQLPDEQPGAGAGGGGAGAATPAYLPVPTLSDDEEDGPSMVGGQTSKDND